jgi:hypothetical protein
VTWNVLAQHLGEFMKPCLRSLAGPLGRATRFTVGDDQKESIEVIATAHRVQTRRRGKPKTEARINHWLARGLDPLPWKCVHEFGQ